MGVHGKLGSMDFVFLCGNGDLRQGSEVMRFTFEKVFLLLLPSGYWVKADYSACEETTKEVVKSWRPRHWVAMEMKKNGQIQNI